MLKLKGPVFLTRCEESGPRLVGHIGSGVPVSAILKEFPPSSVKKGLRPRSKGCPAGWTSYWEL